MIGAIYKKELRARAISLVGIAIMGLAMWAGLWEIERAQRTGYSQPELTLRISFQLGCFAACAVVGLLLGAWSVITELQPGPWAFLRHRPASARALFWGKLAAALTLYAAITGLPLVVGIWWAATHLPGPWIWSMALPPLASFISGTLFVPAGMLVAARNAHWFGSRLLPAGGAIACAAVTWSPWFWLGATAIAVGWLVILPAAISAFATRSIESTQRWPGRFLVSLTLLPATIGIPAAICSFIGEQFQLPPSGRSYQYYQVIDGCIYRIGYAQSGQTAELVVDANGRKWDSAVKQDYMRLITKTPYTGGVSLTLNWKESGYGSHQRGFREPYHYFAPTRMSQSEWWYYVYDWGCFAGYSKQEGEPAIRLGYLGANGFRQQRSEVQPLRPEQAMIQFFNTLVEPNRVLNVSLANRTVTTDFEAPHGERAQSAAQVVRRLPETEGAPAIKVAATDKALYAYDTAGRVSLRVPHPDGYFIADVGALPDVSSYTILYRRSVKWEDWNKPLLMVRVDPTGRELTRLELPVPSQTFYDSGPIARIIESIAIPQAVAFLGIIETIRTGRPDIAAIASLCSAIVCAIIAALVLRPYAVPLRWRIFWLAVVFVFGIGGLLLMFAIRYLPSRVECPNCHRRRLAIREQCEHCAAPFPLPEPGPVGIFDQAGHTAQVA